MTRNPLEQEIVRYRAFYAVNFWLKPPMTSISRRISVLENLKVVYKQSPEDMAADAHELLAAGAAIIGGCCGSTAEHIRHLRAQLDRYLSQD